MLPLNRVPLIRRSWLAWVAALAMLTAPLGMPVFAQESSESSRPATEELLPETTVVFVEIANIRELVEKLKDANIGKLLQDEAIAPLAAELYQQAIDAFDDFTANNGVDLTMEQIQSLPEGEINIAVIAPKRETPVFLFTLEIDEENENVTKIIDLARDAAEADGAEFETSEVEEVEFQTIIADGNRVTYFQKDGVLVASNSEDELTAYLDRWAGREVEKIRPLSENRKFITIMNRCRGTSDLPPDVRLYIDPIELARSGFRGNSGAQLALNFLPVLGLDGLLAIGGSSTMFEGDFESVFHGHVLLANPRKGLFEMIALKPGDYQPPAWVPDDTVLYASTSWDVKKMVFEIEKMVDTFQGEGEFQAEVIDNINTEMGDGFFENIVDSMSGRITFCQWLDRESMAVNAEIPVLAIELIDDHKLDEIRDAIFAKIEEENDSDVEPLVEREHKGVTYWAVNDELLPDPEDEVRRELNEQFNPDGEGDDINLELRADQPAFAVVGNHLLITSSPLFIERAIETERGDQPSLAESEDFRSVTKDITRLAGSDMPAVVMYQQPIETLRHYYKLVQGDDVRNMANSFAGENEYAANVQKAMDDNPLPSFESLEKYFAPTGSFVIADDTGYHLLVFQVMADTDEDDD